MRGKLSVYNIKRNQIGSPPQVRGKPTSRAIFTPAAGITPAGAGKTWRAFEHGELNEDHPRRCGENRCSIVHAAHMQGSPPQVRGKRQASDCSEPAFRITPAGAGKTLSDNGFILFAEDHPRRCGENNPCCCNVHNHLGSPPQVRGKH